MTCHYAEAFTQQNSDLDRLAHLFQAIVRAAGSPTRRDKDVGWPAGSSPLARDRQRVSELERARIGRSRVGLGRVVSDLLECEGREFRGEFA
jgi:hypothetical protein